MHVLYTVWRGWLTMLCSIYSIDRYASYILYSYTFTVYIPTFYTFIPYLYSYLYTIYILYTILNHIKPYTCIIYSLLLQ